MPNRNAGKKASARNFQQSDMATVARSTSLDRGTLLTSPPSPRAGPVIRSAEGAIPQRHTHYLHQKPNESTAAPVGMSKTPSIMDPVNAPPTIDPISTPQNMHPGNAPPMMRPINAPPIIHSDNAPQMMHPGNAPPTMHMGNAPPMMHPINAPPMMHPMNAPPMMHPGNAPPMMHPMNAPPMMYPMNAPPMMHSINSPPMMHPINSPPMMHPGNAPPMMHPTNAPPIMHTGNAPQAMDTNRPSQLKKIPVIDDSMESSPGKTKVTVAQFCPYHERSVFHTAEACRLNPTNQAKNPLSFATVSDTYNNYEKLRQTFQNTNYHTGYAKYRKFVSIVYGDTVSPEEFILKWRNALDDLMRNWGPSNMSYMFPFFQLITAISAHPETSAWLSTLNIEETTSTKGVLNSTIEKFIMAENTRLGIRPPGEEEGAVVPPATQYGWQPPPYYQQAYQGPVWVPQGYPGPVPPGPSAYGMQSPHSGYPDHGHY